MSKEPGWYPDETQPGMERWWNGVSWSLIRREAGSVSTATREVEQAQRSEVAVGLARPKFWFESKLGVVSAVVAIVGWFFLNNYVENSDTSSSSSSQGSYQESPVQMPRHQLVETVGQVAGVGPNVQTGRCSVLYSFISLDGREFSGNLGAPSASFCLLEKGEPVTIYYYSDYPNISATSVEKLQALVGARG